MCLFNCCIFKTLHILLQCQTTVIRARTPDCCYVVLSPTAHIPTYRQTHLPIGEEGYIVVILEKWSIWKTRACCLPISDNVSRNIWYNVWKHEKGRCPYFLISLISGVTLPLPTTLVGQRCHWRRYNQYHRHPSPFLIGLFLQPKMFKLQTPSKLSCFMQMFFPPARHNP